MKRFAVLACTAAVAAPGAVLHASTPGLHGANFWIKCRFSHVSNDDPIVLPGQPGRSHSHTFFGNTSTDAFSTPRSLRAGGTTCKHRADRAAYWVPTLSIDGVAVKPASVGVYHRMKTTTRIHPFPPELKLVAGDAGARRPQSTDVVYWFCWGENAPLTSPPACAKDTSPSPGFGNVVSLKVIFPECWDGRRTDSPDHRAHMRYASSPGVCPKSHPVQVPGISLVIAYPIQDGRRAVLSAGGRFSAHGDFVNGWDQKVLAGIVARCSAPSAKADCVERR